MGQAIVCPQCQQRLSLKSDLEGKRVVCPLCKTVFDAPATNGEQTDAVADTDSQATDSSVPGMEFLSSLPATRTGTKPTSGQTSAKQATVNTGRPKGKKKIPFELYVAGGAVLVLILIGGIAAMMSVPPSGKKARVDKQEKAENIKYGMTELQRRRVFYHLIEFVDKYGMGEPCLKAWRQNVAEYGINNDTIVKILDEGFTNRWPEPDFPAGNAAARKNRRDWIRTRTEMGGVEPILKY